MTRKMMNLRVHRLNIISILLPFRLRPSMTLNLKKKQEGVVQQHWEVKFLC